MNWKGQKDDKDSKNYEWISGFKLIWYFGKTSLITFRKNSRDVNEFRRITNRKRSIFRVISRILKWNKHCFSWHEKLCWKFLTEMQIFWDDFWSEIFSNLLIVFSFWYSELGEILLFNMTEKIYCAYSLFSEFCAQQITLIQWKNWTQFNSYCLEHLRNFDYIYY